MPKKARWTSAQKAARTKAGATTAAKKPHRGQAPRPERTERPGKSERPARPERSPRFERSESTERFERPARPGSSARTERFERPERRRFDGERPERSSQGRGRDERPRFASRDERPRFASRDERPRFASRDERPDRPARDTADRYAAPSRGARPDRDRGERTAYPRFDGDRPRDRRYGDDQPRDRRYGDDRPRDRRFGDDRPRDRRYGDDRPRDRRYGDDRPRDRRFTTETPARGQDAEAERLEADRWTSSARRPLTDGPVSIAPDNGFAALGLAPRLVERLAREGITEPFPIQASTIPDALAGRDVLGRGRTGSGKTLAFGLPTLARLAHEPTEREPGRPRALVLVPTRELAMQVSDAVEPLVHVLGLRHKLVAGGLSYTTQIAALHRGVDLLVATPGRLLDLLERGAVDLGAVEVAIVDEADHMAEMGFLPEVTSILDRAPTGGQRMLFSATLDNGVDELVQRYLHDPVTHQTDEATAAVTTMRHLALLIDPQDKKPATAELAARDGRTIVFVRTKLGADRVAGQLRESGVRAAALHGGLTQGARNKVLGAFRDGRLPVLVATDVAARGIHVDDVSLVLQVDPPTDHKDYVHRAGRTARAGEEGTVVTLVLPHQRRTVERLLREAGVDSPLTKASLGGDALLAAGARAPSGQPVSDEDLRHLLEPAHRRGPGGARGPRHGRSWSGGPPERRTGPRRPARAVRD